ncbi:MAG: PIN domain-containing protein [Micrococcales bacterium]|nr:PIN domain-containing protein [Micrococcales bacterium]
MGALPSTRLVVDASFLIALADQDPDAARFVSVVSRTVATSVNMGEVLYKLDQRAAMTAASTEHLFTRVLGLQVDAVDLAVTRHYPELKRIDARSRDTQTSTTPSSLSLADMTCLAFAQEAGLGVLTGDRHWTTLSAHGLSVPVFDFHDATLTI